MAFLVISKKFVFFRADGNYTPCTNIYGKIAHPKECQLYYDCGRPGSGVGRVLEPNLYECEYPDLFDAKKLECNDYHYVDCGGRRVIKDICMFSPFSYWALLGILGIFGEGLFIFKDRGVGRVIFRELGSKQKRFVFRDQGTGTWGKTF